MRGHDAQELHEGMVLGDSVGAGEEASREDNISDDSTVPRLKVGPAGGYETRPFLTLS